MLNHSKEICQKALKKSGYWQTLKYHHANENVSNNKRNRKWNFTWFNPPFSANVKTKVISYLLNLIRNHFPRKKALHKISNLFNRNTISVNYSYVSDINAETTKHKKTPQKQLKKHPGTQFCNCPKKKHCPLNE